MSCAVARDKPKLQEQHTISTKFSAMFASRFDRLRQLLNEDPSRYRKLALILGRVCYED